MLSHKFRIVKFKIVIVFLSGLVLHVFHLAVQGGGKGRRVGVPGFKFITGSSVYCLHSHKFTANLNDFPF